MQRSSCSWLLSSEMPRIKGDDLARDVRLVAIPACHCDDTGATTSGVGGGGLPVATGARPSEEAG